MSAYYRYIISESHYKILLYCIFFLFVVFCLNQEILNSSMEFLHCSMVLRVIRDSINSSNSFRFTNLFKNIVFELSYFISLMSIRNIMCDDAFFRLLRSSQFSYHFVELFIRTLWEKKSIILKIYLNLLIQNLEQVLCKLDIILLAYKIQYVLLLHFPWSRKKLHSILNLFMKRVLWFWKPSES